MENKAKKSIYGINDAKFFHRMMSGLIDIILTVILATGFLALFTKIAQYDEVSEDLYRKYIEYGIAYESSEGTYEIDGKKYLLIDTSDDTYASKRENFDNDESAIKLENQSEMIAISSISLASLISILILEFAVPLIAKKGRTIGGLLLHIGNISGEGTKAKSFQLFSRAVVGRYALETMVPIFSLFLFGTLPLIIIGIFEIVSLLFSPHNQLIHNYISNLVTVDNDTQYYAETTEDLRKLIEESKESN